MARKITTEIFKQEAEQAHPNKYTYTNTKYVHNKVKVTITCPIHGDVEVLPYQFLHGQGCPKCGYAKATIPKLTTTEFISRAKKVHGDFYDYTDSVYQGANRKVEVLCPTHGKFSVYPFDHFNGVRCKECSRNGCGKVDMKKPCTLYYFNIVGTDLFKIGITGKSLNKRYCTASDKALINLIATKNYATGEEAYNKEQEILMTNSKYLYKGPSIFRTGNTEIFIQDIFKGDYSVFH